MSTERGFIRWNKYTEGQMREAVAAANSYTDALIRLGVLTNSGNYTTLKRSIELLGVDISHFNRGFKNRGNKNTALPIEHFLVKDGSISRSATIKKKIIDAKLVEEKCSSCEIKEWLGFKAPLEIDHINGDNRDNRIENLRLLCPNCHALTPTYRGKNRKNIRGTEQKIKINQDGLKEIEHIDNFHAKTKICKCGKQILESSSGCLSCYPRETKIMWPTPEEIIKMLETSNYFQVGKDIGVTDNSVRKYLKKAGIDLTTVKTTATHGKHIKTFIVGTT